MAFPEIKGVTSGTQASAATQHTITFPSGVQRGDILVVFFSCTTHRTISIAEGEGWILGTTIQGGGSSTGLTGRVFRKVASGDANKDKLALSTDDSAISVWISYRIRGGDIKRFGGNFSAPSNMGQNHNPPNHQLIGNVASDALWFAVDSKRGPASINSAPSNFSDLTVIGDGNDQIAIGVAVRFLNASSLDPGAFSTGNNYYWVATFGLAGAVEAEAAIDGNGHIGAHPNAIIGASSSLLCGASLPLALAQKPSSIAFQPGAFQATAFQLAKLSYSDLHASASLVASAAYGKTATLLASGSVTASARRVSFRQAALFGEATIGAITARFRRRSLSASAEATLSAQRYAVRDGRSSLNAAVGVQCIAERWVNESSAISVSADVVSAAVVVRAASAVLASSASIVAAPAISIARIALDGRATTDVSATRGGMAYVSLAGNANVTADFERLRNRLSILTVAGTVGVFGNAFRPRAASISAQATIAAKPDIGKRATLGANASVTANAIVVRDAQSQLSVAASVAATGDVTFVRGASLIARAMVRSIADTDDIKHAVVQLSAKAASGVVANRFRYRSSPLAGAAFFVGNASRKFERFATLEAFATVAAHGFGPIKSASLGATSAIEAGAMRQGNAAAILAGKATVSADYIAERPIGAHLQATANISADHVFIGAGRAALGATASVDVLAVAVRVASAQFAFAAQVAAYAQNMEFANVRLVGDATISALSRKIGYRGANLASVASVAVDGYRRRYVAADLSVVAQIAVAGERQGNINASLASSAQCMAASVVVRGVSANIAANAYLPAATNIVAAAHATISDGANLAANANAVRSVEAQVSTDSELSASAATVFQSSVILVVKSACVSGWGNPAKRHSASVKAAHSKAMYITRPVKAEITIGR